MNDGCTPFASITLPASARLEPFIRPELYQISGDGIFEGFEAEHDEKQRSSAFKGPLCKACSFAPKGRTADPVTIYCADPADFGFREAKETTGYHKKFSTHNFAFLDGHVDYIFTDTRSFSGRDWTVENESLPSVRDSQSP